MTVLHVALIGLLTGLHAASWGAYKDSQFEGFRLSSFLRSVVLGPVIAVTLALTTELPQADTVLVFIGVCYALERLFTEWWKSILREDDQNAYAIPMRLAVHGKTIDDRVHRYAVGATIAVGLVAACRVTEGIQAALPPLPVWTALVVASVGGWLTAVGGAWKDAPVEGFSGSKFLRSPAVSAAWGVLLVGFTTDWVTLAVAAAGWSVVSIETYKTFLTGNRPPGKFDTKPVRFAVGKLRDACRAAHVGLYVVLAIALSEPLTVPSSAHPGQAIARVVVALAAAMAGGLVLAQPRSRSEVLTRAESAT